MSLYCYFSKEEPSTLATRPPSGSSLVQKDIKEANTAVKAVTKKKARDKYGDYTPEDRARIGKQELPTRSYTRGSLTSL